MRENFFQFCKTSLKNYLEAVGNLLIFLPYFFSVITLLKTLTYPWKNMVTKKTQAGFSFDNWLNRFFFNSVSRTLGFAMRFSMLVFYFVAQLGFIIFIPFITIIYTVIVPLLYLESLFQKTEEEKKKILYDQFCSSHLLHKENRTIVEQWFEINYKEHLKKNQWWKLSNLFSFPPLARDWSLGYTPTLDQYAEDLTSSSYQSKREHIIDRQKEILQIEQVLSKSEEGSVIIVGDEGVGKHTIVDALAKKIYEGRTNTLLIYKRILKLNMRHILTKYTDQEQREHFFDELLQEATDAKNCILLIEDIEKYIDLAGPIEKYVRTANVLIVGITSPFAYQKFIMTNDKIHRLFTVVDVYEIKKPEAEKILLDNAYIYERKHTIHIPYETVREVIEKSDNYVTDIPFPEKAIHLLDSACVYTKQNKKITVLPEYVDEVLTEETHIPITMTAQIKEKLVTLETLLMSQIIQQDEAIHSLCSALRRSFVLFDKRKKPLASFLFLGPTGVGKTQTAKAINQTFFGDEARLIRFDMSLYQTREDIEKLVGSMETNNPGFLTAAIREHPYGVLLLDEIEKANGNLLNIFLTMFDEGYITDGFGKKVDCKNLVIIATSNAGSDQLFRSSSPISPTSLINYLIEKRLFSPEFLNRFDGVMVYQPLTETSVILIAQNLIDEIAKDIYKFHKITLRISPDYLKTIVRKGYDPKFGARNMERIVRNEIEDKVAVSLLENKVKEGDIITI